MMFNAIISSNRETKPLFTAWGGQSNMEGGSVSLTDLPESYKAVYPGIQIWNNVDAFEALDTTVAGDLGLYITALIDLHRFTERTIYAVVLAVGGSTVDEVGASDWNVNSTGEFYDDLKTYITDAKADLVANTIDFEDLAVIWYQGESSDAVTFYTNTTDFIKGVRSHLGNTNLPWILVQLNSVYNAADQDNYDDKIQIQKDIANNVLSDPLLNNIILIPNDGQYPNDGGTNTIHLNAEGQVLIGQYVAQVLYDIIYNN